MGFLFFFFVHLCLSLVPFLFEYASLLTVTHFFQFQLNWLFPLVVWTVQVF